MAGTFNISGKKIGIDASGDDVRVVVVSGDGVAEQTLLKHASPELRARLASGDTCTAAAPAASAILVKLQPPPLPPAKLARVLPSLLDVQLPFALDDCCFRFVPAGAETRAYAVRNSDMESRIAALDEAGCNPLRIVSPAHVAWALAAKEFPAVSEDAPRVVIVADAQNTLLLTGRGRVPETQTVFKTSAPDAVRHVKLNFGGVPQNLTCIVAGSEHAAMSAAFSALDVRTVTANAPEFFMARALAFDTANAGTDRDTNLRTGHFEHTAARKGETRIFRTLCAAFALAAVALVAVSTLAKNKATAYKNATDDAFKNTLFEVAGYPIQSKGSHAVREARAAMPQSTDALVTAYIAPGIAAKLPAVFASAKAHNIVLHHFSFTEKGLSASGTANTPMCIAALLSDLREVGIHSEMDEQPKKTEFNQLSFFIHPGSAQQ